MGGPTPAKRGGGPQGQQQQAELSPRDRGKKIFTANCQTCHQANGLGVPGQYPPLAGSQFTTGGSKRPAPDRLKRFQGPVPGKNQKNVRPRYPPQDQTFTHPKN